MVAIPGQLRLQAFSHLAWGADIVDTGTLIIVPSLYAAPDSLLQRLNRCVKNVGHIV
jgi:hypothetical protein